MHWEKGLISRDEFITLVDEPNFSAVPFENSDVHNYKIHKNKLFDFDLKASNFDYSVPEIGDSAVKHFKTLIAQYDQQNSIALQLWVKKILTQCSHIDGVNEFIGKNDTKIETGVTKVGIMREKNNQHSPVHVRFVINNESLHLTFNPKNNNLNIYIDSSFVDKQQILNDEDFSFLHCRRSWQDISYFDQNANAQGRPQNALVDQDIYDLMRGFIQMLIDSNLAPSVEFIDNNCAIVELEYSRLFDTRFSKNLPLALQYLKLEAEEINEDDTEISFLHMFAGKLFSLDDLIDHELLIDALDDLKIDIAGLIDKATRRDTENDADACEIILNSALYEHMASRELSEHLTVLIDNIQIPHSSDEHVAENNSEHQSILSL